VFIGIPLCVKIPAIEASIPTIEIYFYYFSGFDSIKRGLKKSADEKLKV
jgi:hypothetical protein